MGKSKKKTPAVKDESKRKPDAVAEKREGTAPKFEITIPAETVNEKRARLAQYL